MRTVNKITSCLLMVIFIMAMGGCKASGQESNQPVVKVKSGAGKQEVTRLIAAGKNIQGYSYSYSIAINGDKKTGKSWASGHKRRSETIIDGQKLVTLYDGKQQVVYSYYPAKKEAIKMPAEETPDLVASPEDYLQGILNDQISLLGTTKYQNHQCQLILAQDPHSQAIIKMWVKSDWGIPLRVECTDPDGNSCIVEYSQVKVANQPPGLFKLPPGTKVIDLVQMLSQ